MIKIVQNLLKKHLYLFHKMDELKEADAKTLQLIVEQVKILKEKGVENVIVEINDQEFIVTLREEERRTMKEDAAAILGREGIDIETYKACVHSVDMVDIHQLHKMISINKIPKEVFDKLFDITCEEVAEYKLVPKLEEVTTPPQSS